MSSPLRLPCWPLAGLLLLLGACQEDGPPVAPTSPPSVILVVVDTLRADHLGTYGYARPTSPALDRLADEAVVFEHCVAASSWTQPSTVSLMTGLYPARHGAHSTAQVDSRIEFLAERLQAAGYATAGFSANPNASPLFHMDQGYDLYYFGGNELAREYEDLTVLLDGARQWLAERPADPGTAPRPFFLYLHVMNVHGPYLAPPEYRERFLEEPWSEFEFQGELWTDIVRGGELERRAEVTDAHLADLRARYDGAIAYTDHELGRFFDELRAAGVLDQSLLIVTSDHGEELFERGGFGHGRTLNAEVLNVPLLWRAPSPIQGRVEAPVSLVDLPASVLDFVGLLEPAAAGSFGDGRSFLPLLGGAAEGDQRPLMSEVRREASVAVCLEKWPLKVIQVDRNYEGREDFLEAYRLDQDPREAHDLVPELAPDAPLRRVIDEWRGLALEMRRDLESRGFDSPAIELDAEWREKLGALGYTDQ